MSTSGRGEFGEAFATDSGTGTQRHPWMAPLPVEGDPLAEGKLLVNNSLTGRKDVFVPLKGRTVKWYTCGPTVYDSAHVGHARSYLSFDILRRIMTDYFGYNVLYQVNITDIDDKIILRARQNKLVDDLKADKSVDFGALSALADEAAQASKEDLFAKREKLEQEVAEFESAGKKRDLEEAKEQLNMHLQKIEGFDKELAAIEAAKASETKDREALVEAARGVLSKKLDKEKGASITDHDIFNAHARRYEREFMEDMAALGIREPDVLTRVTEYIPQIIDFIKRIVDKGIGYEAEGSVYLSLDEFRKEHNYRKLVPAKEDTSDAQLEESEGALGDANAQAKRNRNDFALWKASKPGEPAWDSPWGQGRPGWHIECSVIASDILGEHLDFHAGGEDLKFPHHDNELAQSEACFGCQQWCSYFLHAGHLNIKGLKMSKSLKNFITIREALATHTARQLRILFLLQPWDSPMAYSDQKMDDAVKKERAFRSFFLEVENLTRGKNYLDEEVGWRMGATDHALADAFLATQETVHRSLLDNFNTVEAMRAMIDLVSECNKYLKLADLQPAVLLLGRIAVYVTQILKVFGVIQGNDGFGFSGAAATDAGAAEGASSSQQSGEKFAEVLVSFRETVRNAALSAENKSDPALRAILQACDQIRDETLVDMGLRLEDRPEGTKWNLEDPESLRREVDQKRAKEAQERVDKAKGKVDTKEKELTKWTTALTPAEELLRTSEYTAWDDQGVPTQAAGAEGPIPDSQRKKLKKLMDKQRKLNADLAKKSNGDPDAYLAAIRADLEKLQADLAKLEAAN
ncbi:Cysteine--tRNA ligase, cytoplasmic [Hondaea fermentalgiana]|uniref:cysteine--tRNA ligase n=1 Tax=Hondaea fermentalgiana TaxID=2315210 RepID=A0A2R5GGF4_9STRA|nr:Cysteine--tRNA ligase, cytoplasmic [Hondaea fermentalgiana]|eukprot:GBG27733.1 Cysteine--tRNA ligase, cytoplasmic [Hondaea fermentalgiana]